MVMMNQRLRSLIHHYQLCITTLRSHFRRCRLFMRMELLKPYSPAILGHRMNTQRALARGAAVAPLDAVLYGVENLPADEQPAAVYLASLSPGSRRTMRTALHTIAGLLTTGCRDAFLLPWGALRYQHTAALRAALAEKYAPATANKILAALRGVLKAAWRLGHIPTDHYQRAVDVTAVRGETLPRGRALSAGELRALFAVCIHERSEDGHLKPAGARDAALMAVLYGVGLRRSEAVALDADDYDVDTGALRVRSGKGRKARLGYTGGQPRGA